MVYRNKKTGATIETICVCGGDWEEVTETKKEKKAKREPKEKQKEE